MKLVASANAPVLGCAFAKSLPLCLPGVFACGQAISRIVRVRTGEGQRNMQRLSRARHRKIARGPHVPGGGNRPRWGAGLATGTVGRCGGRGRGSVLLFTASNVGSEEKISAVEGCREQCSSSYSYDYWPAPRAFAWA